MAYYDAISNAIAARGNALAQSAQQQGQVYGNLASNLGQLPFQAMQAGQRRRALEVETQQRAAQTQTIQNELDFQKEAYATMNRKDLSPEQLNFEMGNIAKKYGKWEQVQELELRKQAGDRAKFDLLKNTPGSQLPPSGQLALPEPGKSSSVFGPGTFQPQGPVTQPGGMQNAFAPPVPQESQLVHPEIPGLGAPPTSHQTMQGKIAEIDASALSPEDKEMARRALFLPPGLLAAEARGSGSPGVGLGTIEIVSPDGRQVITAQTTRTGQLIETGSGQIIDPAKIAGWTKRHAYQPWIGIGPDNSPVIVNREEISRRGLGTVAGGVPDVKVREQWMPVTDKNDRIIGWTSQSRPGTFIPYDQAAPQGQQGAAPNAPTTQTPQRPDLFKSGQSEATKTAETNITTLQDMINRIDTLSQKHPETAGRVMGNVEKAKAWIGWSDSEVDELITETTSLRNTYLKMVSGGQVTPTEDARLSPVVPDVGQPPARLKNNIARFKRMVNIMAQVRQLGREGATNQELLAAMGDEKGAAPSAPAAGGGGRIVQRNKRTGAVRHSDDQGKTWQPGP